MGGTGILTCCPFDYAFRPGLRSRLTLGGMALPRKPKACGDGDSHPVSRYSFRHNHFHTLQIGTPAVLTLGLQCVWNAPLPFILANESAASVQILSPGNFRRKNARPVSCYALFKWWLLLSQHPGCLSIFTSFFHLDLFRDLSWRSGLFPSRLRNLSPAACLLR